MAKRKASDTPESDSEGDGRLRIVKIRFSGDEMKAIRVAAALADTTSAAYVREVALERAAKDLADHGMTKVPKKKTTE